MITTENYREIYNDLVEETNDFTSDSGVIKCSSKKASDIIREILSGYYGVIDYGISDIEDVNGNVYMIIYNDLIDTDIMESLKLLDEKIVKKGSKWQVQSEKGRNLGTYDTKEKAKERLRQVEYFKHKNESIDDNFKLHHSLKEDIPTFWEWVDNQGLDSDVIEENPDLEEYFRQQYEITLNLKSPEDYDLSDTDVPDDYDDSDFNHQEEESLGYHFVCYYEDDDSPGEQTGNAETLEDAIKMCKGYIDKYNYDNAEIFGPDDDTVATFYEGEWNTYYTENIKDMDLEEIEEINPNISLCKDDYTGKYYIVDNTNQEILTGGTTSLEKAKQLVDDVKEYLSFGESLNEDDSYWHGDGSDEIEKMTSDEWANTNLLSNINSVLYDILPNYKGSKNTGVHTDYTDDGFRTIINRDMPDATQLDANDIEKAIKGVDASLSVEIVDRDLTKKKYPDWGELPYSERIVVKIVKNKNESLADGGLEFMPNKNPVGTPIGRGTGLGEELDEEEPSLECLNCGCDTEWLGTQGDLEEFKCPECGEYYYLTKDGRVVGEEAFQESLTEALINRDMDTIKRKDLENVPIGSVLRLKFSDRPTNTWIDAYSKVNGDNWAVLDDAGEIDGDYNLLSSQSLYWSLMNFDEMTEFEIDTAPGNLKELQGVVENFFNQHVSRKFNGFCDRLYKASRKIDNLKFDNFDDLQDNEQYGDYRCEVGLLFDDLFNPSVKFYIDFSEFSNGGDDYFYIIFNPDGTIDTDSEYPLQGKEMIDFFKNHSSQFTKLIDNLFKEAYSRFIKTLKNAGINLGESLDEAKNDTLNPAIWENEELKPEVKEKLQFIADKFIEKLKEDEIPLDVDDIVIVGSNRNYNYGPQSDIDLHIIADLSQFKGREKELAEKIYQCKKSIFNDKYDPMINGFEVEIYVEPAEDKNDNDIPDEVE